MDEAIERLAELSYKAWQHDSHNVYSYPYDEQPEAIKNTHRISVKELIEHAGYLRVEPVQLEELGDEEIRAAMKQAMDEAQLYGDDGEPLPEKGVSQATNIENEKKGQLYRIKGGRP